MPIGAWNTLANNRNVRQNREQQQSQFEDSLDQRKTEFLTQSLMQALAPFMGLGVQAIGDELPAAKQRRDIMQGQYDLAKKDAEDRQRMAPLDRMRAAYGLGLGGPTSDFVNQDIRRALAPLELDPDLSGKYMRPNFNYGTAAPPPMR